MSISLNRKRQIILFVSIVAIVCIAWFFFHKVIGDKEKKFSMTPPAVTVGKAVFGPVSKYINTIGTLRPSDSVVLKSEVSAKVKKICFTEGSTINENDLLVELDDSMAEAQLMEAKARYQRAKCEFEPTNKLADKGVMARTQRDIKKADMETAWAAVLSNERNLSKHKIYAPFGGIAGLKEISKGQFVSPGVELVKVVDCTPLKVDFKVAEADIDKIYVSQEAQILVGGDATKSYTAKIIAVDPESDKVTHTFDVRAVLNVPEGISEVDSQAIKPGRFVSVKIAANGEQQGILIPESCLEKIGDEDVVYRIVDGIAIRTLVTVGTRRDGNVEIITGINEGDLVVTSGQAGVLDGKGVSIKDESSTSDVVKAVKEIYEQQKNAKAKTAPAKANTSKK